MKPKKLFAALLSVTCALPLAGCTAFTRIDISHYENAKGSLINPDASAEAAYLMQYLKGIYGKQILSGQYINEYEDYDQPKFRQDENNPDSVPTGITSCSFTDCCFKICLCRSVSFAWSRMSFTTCVWLISSSLIATFKVGAT